MNDVGAPSSRWRWLAPGFAGSAGLFWALAAWSRRWLSDDGLINARVIENLLAGHGPVFNVGERVEATTSAAWLWLATGLAAVTGDVDGALVYGGFACSVAAVVLALWPRRTVEGRALAAVGLLGWLPLSVAWDFATSGLENGLAALWLVATWRAGREAPPETTARALALGGLVGLGPLVRPEFALHLVVVVLAWLAWARARPRGVAAALVFGATLPLGGYTLFRGAYYATLVPNTALAKGASQAAWSEGAAYLVDFAGTYQLAVPLGALLALWWLEGAAVAGRERRWSLLLLGIAALHGLYVVRLGGDFMHGRMFLAPWLLACLALGELDLGRLAERRRQLALLALVGWAALAAGLLRADHQPGALAPQGIVDERRWYLESTTSLHPTGRGDHAGDGWSLVGRQAGALRGACGATGCAPPVLLVRAPSGELDRFTGSGEPGAWSVAVVGARLGGLGAQAGLDVHVIDSLGLAEPLVARMQPTGARPGHRKQLPVEWLFARYAQAPPRGDFTPNVAAGREALRCGPLRELLEAITAPLTPSRALANLALSPRLTRLAVPNDPGEARRVFCADAASR